MEQEEKCKIKVNFSHYLFNLHYTQNCTLIQFILKRFKANTFGKVIGFDLSTPMENCAIICHTVADVMSQNTDCRVLF